MLLISALCGVACNFFCKNSIILILFAYLCVNVMRIFKPKIITMKKFFYLLLALPLVFASCEPLEPTPANDPVLTLTSDATMRFLPSGGEGVITYTLENAVAGTNLTATCDAQWVTNLTAGETVTFEVEANTTANRETKIVVAYGKASFEVTVQQSFEPNDDPAPVPEGIVREAQMLIGDYYADQYTEAHNYYFCLTNYGLSEDGYPYAGGYYYFLDVYGVASTVDAEGFVTIPAGTYTFELNPSYAEGTIANNEYSMYMAVNEEGTDYAGMGSYTEATLKVKENSMTLSAIINGEEHIVTYVGAPKFYVGAPIEDDEVVATSLVGYYYGTEYSATYNMGIYLSDLGYDDEGYAMPGGKYYELDIYTDVQPTIVDGYVTIPNGTYTFDASDSTAAWTIGYTYSAYYVINAEGTEYDAEAYYDDAELVVTDEGMTLTATIQGSEHVVTYVGAPTFFDPETRAASKKASHVKVEKKAMFVM